MLPQDNPFAGKGRSLPRALPIRYVLAWKVRRVRRRVQRLRRTHDGIGWALVGAVLAVGVGLFIGHL